MLSILSSFYLFKKLQQYSSPSILSWNILDNINQGSNYRFALRKLRSEFWLLQLESWKWFEKCETDFFPRKFNLYALYFSTLYPHFTLPLHTIIKRNIAHTQNYIAKCKKCFAVLKKISLRWALTPCFTQHAYYKINFK